MRKKYATDLTDEQWQKIFAKKKTGLTWRTLPACFGKWQSVPQWFTLWYDEGIFESSIRHEKNPIRINLLAEMTVCFLPNKLQE